MPLEPDRADADQQSVVAFHKELPRLRGWLRRHATAWQGVDDLLQDLFLELVLANRGAQRIEQVGAWLFQVARHRITDALRHRQPLNRAISIEASPGLSAALEGGQFDNSTPPTAEAAYRQQRFVQELVRALQELPEEQRRVFLAHEIEGLSMAEIAHRDGVGVNTTLARKRYAVMQLRTLLADFDEDFSTY